ncbi:hypothetical protein DFQ26_008180 [Actinomortierella ambigua]|nr:hypothetical protein DFQ26_008180 [Actinomortierella ambigua]
MTRRHRLVFDIIEDVQVDKQGRGAKSHQETLYQEQVFKYGFEGGEGVVVDDDNGHLPHHFLEVDPAISGVQFILFSNAARPVLARGFTPQVRVYRPQKEAADQEIGRFLARMYYSGMLQGVVVILVTKDCGLENAVLQLKDKGLKTASVYVNEVVAVLRSRHPRLFY